MILSPENYFSPEAMQEYFSVSQYKDFVGTYGIPGCEARAMAKLRGEWRMEMTTALLVGSYVDAHFEGTLGVFKAQHQELFRRDGDLKSSYQQANEIIARIERDPFMMRCLSGQKQVIFTGEIFGVKWKCKVDSFVEDKFICDLKVMESLRKQFYVKDLGRISFVEHWGYNTQAAIYQKLVEINTGKKLPFLIAAASKEEYPDIEVIGFAQQDLDDTMSLVFKNIGRINDLKQGRIDPDRCEQCDFCRATKVLTRPLHFSELIEKP